MDIRRSFLLFIRKWDKKMIPNRNAVEINRDIRRTMSIIIAIRARILMSSRLKEKTNTRCYPGQLMSLDTFLLFLLRQPMPTVKEAQVELMLLQVILTTLLSGL
jgi:hypothetical protein